MIRLKLIGDMTIAVGIESAPIMNGMRKDSKANRRPEGSEGLLREGLTDFQQSALHKRFQGDRQPR
jgi:hypothetical protein